MLDWLKETEMSPQRHGLAPPRRAGCGEGGKDSTLDVAKAIADYAS